MRSPAHVRSPRARCDALQPYLLGAAECSATHSHAFFYLRPDEVVESSREETDGKPLESLDAGFLRPFLGRDGSERLFDAFSGMSEAFRMAQEIQGVLQSLLPGACVA